MLLDIENINVYYEEIQVLWDVSISIKDKDIVALLGSNAAGKTTLIRALSGLDRARSGTIHFDGKDITQWDTAEIVEAGVVHVPEGGRMFGNLTVEENLKLGAYSRRGRARYMETLESVYELFPRLAERKNQMASSMSGGEQQMCAIARGLMARPRLLIIDELSLGLAPILVKRLFEKLIQINASGVAILLVEQNVKQSLEVASRAFVLENGRIALQGTSEEVSRDAKLKEAYLGIS